jgi:stage V sporulation protein SpoVS
MADIDLIPQDYKNSLIEQSVARWSVIISVIVVSSCFAIYLGLKLLSNTSRDNIEVLQNQRSVSAAQNERLNLIVNTEKQLRNQLDMVRRLNKGAQIAQIFQVIDDAFVADGLWFLEWRFERQGISQSGNSSGTNTGYIIVVDPDKKSKEDNWAKATNMVVKGQAVDHAYVAQFVSNLIAHPNVNDVRIMMTEQRTLNSLPVIEFQLAIILGSRGPKS